MLNANRGHLLYSVAKLFELEIYWGTPGGALLHGTVQIEADDLAEAELLCWRYQTKPDYDDLACARHEYFEDYYDVEPLWEVH